MKGWQVTTDLELVDRVRAGDVPAFAELVTRYERSVLAVVQAELRDTDQAQVVAKATLLTAFRRLNKLPDGTPFGAWLLRLARHQSIEAVRKMPVAVGAGDSDCDFCCVCDPAWIEHEHLLGLVARLPDEERQLITLQYFDDHSLPEIATLTGKSVAQVSRQASLAMMRLQYWWTREQDL